jgi:hypothetical protein
MKTALELLKIVVGFTFDGSRKKVEYQQKIWEARDAEKVDEAQLRRLHFEYGYAQARAGMGRAWWAEFGARDKAREDADAWVKNWRVCHPDKSLVNK